jgi:hypothetical protein
LQEARFQIVREMYLDSLRQLLASQSLAIHSWRRRYLALTGEKGVFMPAATVCQIRTPSPFTPVEVDHDGYSGDGDSDDKHRGVDSCDTHLQTTRGE